MDHGEHPTELLSDEPEGLVEHVRALLRPLRHTPDRLMRGPRGRRAHATLHAGPHQSVLFVCEGNICRSPYAEAAFRGRLDDAGAVDITVSSAGFAAPGRTAPPEAVEAAARRGIDLSKHRSSAQMDDADLVFVMEAYQRTKLTVGPKRHPGRVLLLGDLDPEWGGTRAIIDPVCRPPAFFDRVYGRIDRCLDAVASALVGPG